MQRRSIFSPVEALLLVVLGALLSIGFFQAWLAQQQRRQTFTDKMIARYRQLPIP